MRTTIIDGESIEVNPTAAKCKICGCDLILELATNYPTDKDPMKLIPFATCNRCYDLRDRKIRIETSFKRLCYQLDLEKLDDSKRQRIHELIKLNASNYSKWCAEILRRQHTANVSYLVDAIIKQPSRWYFHLQDFETAVNQ